MLDMIASFILSVLASVVAYYICKWLDEEIQAVASLRINPPALKTEQKTPSAGTLGVFVLTTNHDRDNIFCLEVVYHIPLAKSSIYQKFSFNSRSSHTAKLIILCIQPTPLHSSQCTKSCIRTVFWIMSSKIIYLLHHFLLEYQSHLPFLILSWCTVHVPSKCPVEVANVVVAAFCRNLTDWQNAIL